MNPLTLPVVARRLLLIFVGATVLLTGWGAATAYAASLAGAADGVRQAHQALAADLLAAGAAGYSSEELSPVLSQVAAVQARPRPVLPNQELSFYAAQRQDLLQLRRSLTALEDARFELLQRVVASRITELKGEAARDRRLGVDAADVDPLDAVAAGVQQALAGATTPTQLREAFTNLGPALDAAARLRAEYENQLAATEAEAQHLKAVYGGNLEGLRGVAQAALTAGRNDAAWEAMMRLPDLGRPYAQLEANAARVRAATDLDSLAAAVALEERYRDQVHAAFTAGLPRKVFLVSIASEELWAYDHGQLFVDTLVTTGRPELPTDVGLMRIMRKESPVHFISPFPKGSPYDYGTIDARYAMFFQFTGEAIHDSWWRSWYGPGSNIGNAGSHGCIGVPYGPIDRLYPWGDLNVPVVVIPGDGSTPAAQLAQKTYDDPWWGYGPPLYF